MGESIVDIYDYLFGLFFGRVTENIYPMNVPQQLTKDDVDNGFMVLKIDAPDDKSEFAREAYGQVRCYVVAYVPLQSRGRLDKELYTRYESDIREVVNHEIRDGQHDRYTILDDRIIASDNGIVVSADNPFMSYIMSFIVQINSEAKTPAPLYDLYIGVGAAEISGVEDLIGAQYFKKKDASGDYSVTFGETAYLWICSQIAIGGVTSSGFAVPMESEVILGGFRCYRSGNSIIQGEMNFTIN